MALKNISYAFLLMLAIGLSSWSIIVSHPFHTPILQSDPKEADSFMQDVVAVIFNKEGKPALKLEAPHMIHYPENDSTLISTPHVTIYRQTPKPWYVDAEHAKTNHGINEIVFWSHVNIHHPADQENPKTSLKTATLTIHPDQKTAVTDQPIIFNQPDTTIHAIGMLADWEAGTIKLLSETQGDYVSS
jgi:lipopolysaccharide export system protein LptC